MKEVYRLTKPFDPKRCQYEQAVERYFGIEVSDKPQKLLLTDHDLVDLVCSFDSLNKQP